MIAPKKKHAWDDEEVRERIKELSHVFIRHTSPCFNNCLNGDPRRLWRWERNEIILIFFLESRKSSSQPFEALKIIEWLRSYIYDHDIRVPISNHRMNGMENVWFLLHKLRVMFQQLAGKICVNYNCVPTIFKRVPEQHDFVSANRESGRDSVFVGPALGGLANCESVQGKS